jgi:oligosaccharide repeat unit polymerase
VTGEDSVGTLVGNYISAGLVFLPLFIVGVMTRKIGAWFVVALSVPWLLLGLLIGGRGGLITVILSSLYVYLSFGSRLSVKAVSSFFIVFAVILVAGNLLVGKIDAGLEDGTRDVILQSVKGFFDYFFAGPILFSKYMEDPTQIIPTWDALIFPCHVLEKLGLCSVPNIHQEFLAFNRDGDIGNVYSVVFSIFPKYGLVGLLALMFFYGLAASHFHRSRNDGIFPLLISGFLFYATALSIYLDAFAPSIYFFLKVYVITLVIKFAFTTPVTGSDNAGRVAA